MRNVHCLSNANNSTEHIWLPTDTGAIPVAFIHNSQTYAVETDHLDTPRRISNAQNQTLWQWEYSGFGEKEAQNTPAAPKGFAYKLRYPGQYFDSESGLFYNWHRSYDPQTGRYTQPDPIGLEGGWNRFTYVENNPIWAIDPQGLQAATWSDAQSRMDGNRLSQTVVFALKTVYPYRSMPWGVTGACSFCWGAMACVRRACAFAFAPIASAPCRLRQSARQSPGWQAAARLATAPKS